MRHGELQDRLLVVESGSLRVVPRARDATGRQAAAMVGVGGVVGEMAVLFRAAGPRVSKGKRMRHSPGLVCNVHLILLAIQTRHVSPYSVCGLTDCTMCCLPLSCGFH
jgi:CRP-like cAMP-binding protein